MTDVYDCGAPDLRPDFLKRDSDFFNLQSPPLLGEAAPGDGGFYSPPPAMYQPYGSYCAPATYSQAVGHYSYPIPSTGDVGNFASKPYQYGYGAAPYGPYELGYSSLPAPTKTSEEGTTKNEEREATVRIVNGKPKKLRKPRTIYSSFQLAALQRRFERTQYLALPERAELAATLGLTQTQIKIWFQNRRSKFKKINKSGEGIAPPQASPSSSDPMVCNSPSPPTLWDSPNPTGTVTLPGPALIQNYAQAPWYHSQYIQQHQHQLQPLHSSHTPSEVNPTPCF
uniref:homeobox protein DLL-3-like n=1 Tax=Myxine glutinosa TaxID=7769 RepID=UPI00358E761E